MEEQNFEEKDTTAPEVDLTDDWLRAVDKQDTFNVGGKDLELTLYKTGIISACYDNSCHELGEGEQAYNALRNFLELGKDGTD